MDSECIRMEKLMSKQRPVKLSNFIGLDNEKMLEQYIRTLDSDIFKIVEFLRSYPRQYSQAAEPSLDNGDWGFWHNTSNDRKYLMWKTDDEQVKMEMG